jgi:hypothetical protein
VTINRVIFKIAEDDGWKSKRCNKFEQTEKRGMSHQNLTKWRAFYKAWLDFRVNRLE